MKPPAGPTRGDLTHLTYTATHDLHAALVAPTVRDTVTSELAQGRGRRRSRAAAWSWRSTASRSRRRQLGARAVDKQSGATVYTFYGVRFAPGPNDVAADRAGRGRSARRDDAPAPSTAPASRPRCAPRSAGELRADGTTPVLLTVHALDAWHHPALARQHRAAARAARRRQAAARARAAGRTRCRRRRRGAPRRRARRRRAPRRGRAERRRRAAPRRAGAGTRSTSSVGTDGDARVLVVPGTVSGDATVGFASGDAAGDESVFVKPFLRKALVVGLVSAGAGAAPGSRDGDDHVDDGGSKRGRAAFFASGEALRGRRRDGRLRHRQPPRAQHHAGAVRRQPRRAPVPDLRRHQHPARRRALQGPPLRAFRARPRRLHLRPLRRRHRPRARRPARRPSTKCSAARSWTWPTAAAACA